MGAWRSRLVRAAATAALFACLVPLLRARQQPGSSPEERAEAELAALESKLLPPAAGAPAGWLAELRGAYRSFARERAGTPAAVRAALQAALVAARALGAPQAALDELADLRRGLEPRGASRPLGGLADLLQAELAARAQDWPQAEASLRALAQSRRPEARRAAALLQGLEERARAPLGSRIQPFALRALDGSAVELRSLAGRVVLLHFWSTTCLPCRAEAAELAGLQRRFAAEGLALVGFALDPPAEAAHVREFAAQRGMDWPHVLEGAAELARSHGIHRLPANLLLDRAGVLRQRDAHGAALETAIAALVAGGPSGS